MNTDHLTDEQIEDLLRLAAAGHGYKSLARTFQLNETTARNIVLGRVRNQGQPMKPWAPTSGKHGQGPS